LPRLLLLAGILLLTSCITTNTTYLHPAKDMLATPPQVLPPSAPGLYLEGGAGLGIDSGMSLNRQTLYGQTTWRYRMLSMGLGASIGQGHSLVSTKRCYYVDGSDSTCYTSAQWNALTEGASWKMATVDPTLALVFDGAQCLQFGLSFSVVYAREWGDYSAFRDRMDQWEYVEKVGGNANWYRRYGMWTSVLTQNDIRLGLQINNDVTQSYDHKSSDGLDLFGEWTLAVHGIVQKGPLQFILGMDAHGTLLRFQYQIPLLLTQ
jgi:hypothetical protein